MSTDKAPDLPERDGTLQTRFRIAGVLILAAGLLAAAVIDRRAASPDPSAEAISQEFTKRYEADMERMGGKSNLAAAEFREWFGSLWHGKRLARTVAVLSIGGGLACFAIAHLLEYPPAPSEPPAVEKP